MEDSRNGQNISILFIEDLSVKFALQLFAGKIPSFTIEKRYICKDSSILWADTNFSLAHDTLGYPKFADSITEAG
jgi:hypothetical protein